MRRMGAVRLGATRACPPGFLAAALLFAAAATGCNNTCVRFTSNPSTGTLVIKVSDAKPTCTLSTANGTIRLQVSASPVPGGGSEPSRIQHIFVSLRGIEAHPGTVADGDSPDWQQLAPQLGKRPVQVDLMAGTTGSCTSGSLGEAVVPAGAYRQIRLRLVPNQPATSEPVLEENACGSVGFNCVITSGGGIRSLALDGAEPKLRIGSEHIAGGFFLVLPDVGNDLAIEFNTSSSLVLPAGDAIRLVPVFTAAPRAACQSRGGSER